MIDVELRKYKIEYPEFSDAELNKFRGEFNVFDIDRNGTIEDHELKKVLEQMGEAHSDDKVKELLNEYETEKGAGVNFSGFLAMIRDLRKDPGTVKGFAQVYKKAQKLVRIEKASGAVHSFAEEERRSFVEHIKYSLGADDDVKEVVGGMQSDNDDLFHVCKDGIILCKLINVARSETIDERSINKKKKKDLSKYEIIENQNLALNSARGIGCSVVNIGAEDLFDAAANPHLVMGLLWQIIKAEVLADVTLTSHPELVRLLEENEELSSLTKLSPEKVLIRWVNFHLKESGSALRIKNFSADIKDSQAYAILLSRIAPVECGKATDILASEDMKKRAEGVLAYADKINCRRFVSATDIVKGQPKLNLAFVATLFNTRPGLKQVEADDASLVSKMAELLDDEGDSREERAFRFWLNSMNLDVHVNNLFEDLRDTLVILQAMDAVEKGSVEWKRVQKAPKNQFQKVGNLNYAVDLGKEKPFLFSLVGIGGKDLLDGNKKLTLALVWQLLRHHTLNLIKGLRMGGKEVSDAMLVKWANESVKARSPETRLIRGLNDSSLADGIYLLQLISSIDKEGRVIDWSTVKRGGTDDAKRDNAKYIISSARKLGCTVFLLWEDIVEVKPKMILTLIGSLMGVALSEKASKQ